MVRLFRALLPLFAISINSCLSVMIPPITLTGTKTAVEKQIIGEENELEEDVWMISSARVTSEVDLGEASEDEQAKIDEENSYTYRAFAILNAFGDDLAQLKQDRVVGEDKNGLIANLVLVPGLELPEESREKYDPKLKKDPVGGKDYRMLEETVKQVNIARKHLVEGYIINRQRNEPDYKPNREELLRTQKEKYHASALKGEYIQKDDGTWVAK